MIKQTLRYDAGVNTLTYGDQQVTFTGRSAGVMELLCRQHGKLVRLDELIRFLDPHARMADARTYVGIIVHRIRRRAADAGIPITIRNVHGEGYAAAGIEYTDATLVIGPAQVRMVRHLIATHPSERTRAAARWALFGE